MIEFWSDCTNISLRISPEQNSTRPTANGEHQPEAADIQSANQRTDDGTQVVNEVQEEKNLTSTPEKAPPTLAPLQLAQLRTENADSFDMEEVRVLLEWVLHTFTGFSNLCPHMLSWVTALSHKCLFSKFWSFESPPTLRSLPSPGPIKHLTTPYLGSYGNMPILKPESSQWKLCELISSQLIDNRRFLGFEEFPVELTLRLSCQRTK